MITIPLSFLTTAVLIWISYLLLLVDRGGRYTDPMFRLWARAVMAICGVRPNAYGLTNVEPRRNYIVVSNHLSLIDSPLLVAFLPVSLRFLAKRELLKIPVMGGYMSRTGHVPISRGDPRETVRSMNEAAKLIRKEGKSLLVYPEGTRSKDGVMQPFKDGAALLAIKAGLPILPVAVRGTERILPSKGVVIRGGPAELLVGCPIETEGMELKDRAELTRQAEAQVRQLLA